MKRNLFIFCTLMLLFCAFLSYRPESDTPKVYIPSSLLPNLAHSVENVFEDYEIIPYEMDVVPTFFGKKDIVFTFDVEALPLIENGMPYYFEPMYYDVFVVAVEMSYTKQRVENWGNLLQMGLPVSIPYYEPHSCYLAVSHSLSMGESGDVTTHIHFLRNLQEHSILRFSDPTAPVQVMFLTEAIRQIRDGRELTLSFPQEGGACFAVGLFSRQPFDEKSVEKLRFAFQKSVYPKSLDDAKRLVGAEDGALFDAGENWREFSRVYEPTSKIRRDVLGIRKFAPADGQEYQLMALIIIGLIVSSLTYVSFHIVRPEVRRGIWYMGIVLVLWISVMLMQYALPRRASIDLSLALWYLYYVFILTLPILSMYIAENANRLDRVYFTKKLVACGVVSIALALLVLTNNFHENVFEFFGEDKFLRVSEYKRQWGYYLIVAWFFVAQLASFAELLLQNWNSPRRKQMALPLLTFILGFAYVALYNINYPLVTEIPFTFAISLLVISYFALAIFSGLIQSNRYYIRLFEQSSLDMQIYDSLGNLRYQTKSSTGDFAPDLEKNSSDSMLLGNRLIWQQSISGGTLVSKEDITNVLALQNQLEQATKRLEKENEILSKKHSLEGKLLLLRAQGRLLYEVNKNTESKISQMRDILLSDQVADEEKLQKIHLLSLYCKRRCEQLIHFQSKKTMSGKELGRIILESANILSPKVSVFCTLENDCEEECAVRLYDMAHELFHFVVDNHMEQVTVKIYQSEGEGIFYAMLDSMSPEKLQQIFPAASIKDFGDAISLTMRLPSKGGRK